MSCYCPRVVVCVGRLWRHLCTPCSVVAIVLDVSVVILSVTDQQALRPTPSSSLDGLQLPKLVETIFKGLRGCMALIILRCYGDASFLEQRSALRAIHPLNTPNIISACSGDRHPSILCIGTRRNASCGALGGHFRRWRPWL